MLRSAKRFVSCFHKLPLHVRNGLLLGLLVCLMLVPGSLSSAKMLVNDQPRSTAAPASLSDCSGPRQLRAVWLATVQNTDWPSRPGLAPSAQQQEFRALLDQVQRIHLNTVIVQVRPQADAFYPSQFAPWSQYLTGKQGKDPGYDPLAFMLTEAHKRHLSFQAWFNPYRVSLQDDPSQLAPDHPARRHPDWLVRYGGQLYYNPGLPAVREFVVASILEVVRRYAIDGVHLDDYFYPYPVAGQDFPDDATYQRYGAAKFPRKADWRRDNINQLVHELFRQIHALRPGVSFGISPFGIWRNRATDPAGSDTRALQSYDDLYADTRYWLRHHWLDYIAPQLYWNIGYPAADYQKLLAWWSDAVAGSQVQLVIGQAAYQILAWQDPQEIERQLKLNQHYPVVRGSIFFSLKDLLKNPRGFTDRLRDDFYRCPAQIP